MKLFDNLFNRGNNKTDKPVVRDNFITTSLPIHPDIMDLLWIADGPNKNWDESQNEKVYSVDNQQFVITVKSEEPSLLYMSMPIQYESNNINDVERPPYYPSYKELNPEQKGLYWKFLSNPYDTSIDIGYVFILYYGLERHLLMGNYEKAYKVVEKLRDVHDNSSFQFYSANALIYSSMLHNRTDLLAEFLESCDKDYEKEFSSELFLFSKMILNLPLVAEDIMRLFKAFGFSKRNYIKNYPELFTEALNNQLQEKYQKNYVMISDFITPGKLDSLEKETKTLYANISISENQATIPVISSDAHFSEEMNQLLNNAHENVKKILADYRKQGIAIEPQNSDKKKDKIIEVE